MAFLPKDQFSHCVKIQSQLKRFVPFEGKFNCHFPPAFGVDRESSSPPHCELKSVDQR